ncbi:MAG: basic secretory family protein [Anaerolineae bacterium]|nr:basic secretory family protein [Anaerolineae bacterium]
MRKQAMFLISAALVLIFMLGLIGTAQWQATAQDATTATPTPEETPKYEEPAYVEGGEAEWTLTDSTFTSLYPDGFQFEAFAKSSAGEIVSASIYYSHTPTYPEDVRRRGEVDAETGKVMVIVEGREADEIPPWVAINYRWRLLDSAGTIYWSDWFVGNEYSDDTHEWEREESEDLIIFVQEGFPQNAVDLAFEAMAEARPLYLEAFGRLLSYKPRMVLFADETTFEEWRSQEYVLRGIDFIGQASGYWGAFIQLIYGNDIQDFAYGTVIHEIGHLYQYDLYEGRAPAWFIEGNSTYLELSRQYDYEGRVRDALQSATLDSVFVGEGVDIFDEGPDSRGRWGYDLGYTFNKWLVENYGWEAHRELIALLAAPENLPGYEITDYFKTSLEQVLGLTIIEIESQWREWLGISGTVPTQMPSPTIEFRFPPTVTPFGQ